MQDKRICVPERFHEGRRVLGSYSMSDAIPGDVITCYRTAPKPLELFHAIYGRNRRGQPVAPGFSESLIDGGIEGTCAFVRNGTEFVICPDDVWFDESLGWLAHGGEVHDISYLGEDTKQYNVERFNDFGFPAILTIGKPSPKIRYQPANRRQGLTHVVFSYDFVATDGPIIYANFDFDRKDVKFRIVEREENSPERRIPLSLTQEEHEAFCKFAGRPRTEL